MRGIEEGHWSERSNVLSETTAVVIDDRVLKDFRSSEKIVDILQKAGDHSRASYL